MNKKVISLAIGGGLIILGFLAYFISKGNFEFLGYAIVVAILLCYENLVVPSVSVTAVVTAVLALLYLH